MHYAVVVDKSNSINSPVVTVVPLTSVKPHTNIKRLHRGNVFLGNELFIHLSSKISTLDRRIEEDIAEIQKAVPDFKTAHLTTNSAQHLSGLNVSKKNTNYYKGHEKSSQG